MSTVPAADFEYPAVSDTRSAGVSIHAYLAKAWCDLNRTRYADVSVRVRMAEIEAQIGRRECLREWNRGMMTNEEFEAWWHRRGCWLTTLRFSPTGGTTA